MDLLDDDNDASGSGDKIAINEHYAKAFNYKKEREEYMKLKAKYGSDGELDNDEDDSSESESEDEDGEELTPAVDAAILRTLNRIRKKDPVIYDSAKSVFQAEAERTSASTPWGFKPSKDKSKPITVKQQNMDALLNGARSRSPSPSAAAHIPTYNEEQRAMRQQAISAFHQAVEDASDADDDDLGGGLLTLREKTKDELERQEEEYRAYLEREVGDVQDLVSVVIKAPEADEVDTAEPATSSTDPAKDKAKKKKENKKEKAKGNKKAESDQEFLMNYILNRGWIDRESRHLPTYSEITENPRRARTGGATQAQQASSSSYRSNSSTLAAADPQASTDVEGAPNIEELEEFEDVADVFESSYNFRFEEPGAAEIARHPRNIEGTVRRENTTRKDARERRKARKEEEIARKTEEVKRLKAFKLRELRHKLDLVGKEGGLADLERLEGLDLEGEWDPNAHDEQMATLYGSGDYAEGEDPELDLEKPNWDDDIDITDLVPPEDEPAIERKSKKQKKKEERRKAKAAAEALTAGDGAVDEAAMDAENMESAALGADEEEWDGTEEMRKRKVAEYMDEIYGLEFNDVIGGDIATRFKYATTDKTSYHLTPAEILLATDAELNQYMGVKKYAPYRKGKDRWDATKGDRLRELKDKVRQRAWGAWAETKTGDGEQKKPKRKGKKEREKEKASVVIVPTSTVTATDDPNGGAAASISGDGSHSREEKKKRKVDGEDAGKGGQDAEGHRRKRRRKKKDDNHE